MIKIGVIGLGNGGGNHARSLAKNRHAKVVALADVDPVLLRRTAAECGVSSAYMDWRELLKNKEVEAVVLVTPPFLRQEMFVAAAKAGKHILAEKPLGVSLAQAKAMERAAERYGVKAMVNFGTRNLPTYRKLRSLIRSGKFGKPQFVWFKYYLPACPRVFMPPPWFWRKALSGGHLQENAGHAIDLICELLGPVRSVTGVTAQLPIQHFGGSLKEGKPDIENLGVAVLRHPGGRVTALANGCNPAGQWGMSFDIVTENCVVTVSGDRTIEVVRDGRRIYRHVSPVGWDPIPYGGRAFVRFVSGRTAPSDSIATVGDGVRAMEIAAAAYRSAASARTVSLASE